MNNDRAEKSKGNILIVDDTPENLRILSSLLSKQGYKVRSVSNGQMALFAAQNERPDLILLDIVLPDRDGYKVCEALKADARTRDIPIIFISGLDEEYDKVKAFQAGGVDYVTKPFFLEETILRIENQLKFCKQKQLLQEQLVKQSWERQQTEKQLLQSRALLSGVLNSSLDGVAAFEAIRDREGKIIDFRWVVANPVAAMTVGKTTENLIGQRLQNELPGYLFDGLFDSFVRVVETCTVLDKEHYYGRDMFEAVFHIVAVKLGDGFAMTFRDITESKQMELALQKTNRELHRQANIDSLTGVPNRRRFDEHIALEWARCAREQQPMSLILCDVDYFKLYNDTYGHQTGDDCLTKVAHALGSGVKRSADLVARYGGEEFAVILPNTDGFGAMQVAEKIRQNVKILKIPHSASKASCHVSLSLGVACTIPNYKISPEHLISAADRALYDAKESGRDRAVLKIVELPLSS